MEGNKVSELEPTQRFTDRVENYVKYRPHYPLAFFEFLESTCGLGAESSVADIGSGTGIATEPLLKLGCRVYAVEPNDAMRAAAEAKLGKVSGFRSINGTAEHSRLSQACVHLVLAAQAFHWFDTLKARAEFQRILEPEGWVVLLWNERIGSATPFLEAYERLLRDFGTDYQKVRHDNVTETATIGAFFGKGGHHTVSFPNKQILDFEGLKGRLLSSSYVPKASDPKYEPMLVELKAIFEKHNESGKVSLLYDTKAYYGRLT